MLAVSLSLVVSATVAEISELLCCETICAGGETTGGVGGSGLFKSESALFGRGGDAAGSVTEKSEKDTVCGVLALTSFP